MMANALGRERLRHDGGEIGVLARQELRRHVDDGDVAAQPAEGLRHFAADRSRARDDERGHGLAQIEDGFVGEVGRGVEAGNVGHRRAASRWR